MKNPIWRPEPRLDVALCFLQTSCFYPLVSSDLKDTGFIVQWPRINATLFIFLYFYNIC